MPSNKDMVLESLQKLNNVYFGHCTTYNSEKIRRRLNELLISIDDKFLSIESLSQDMDLVLTSLDNLISLSAPDNLVNSIAFDLKPRFENANFLYDLLIKHGEEQVEVRPLVALEMLFNRIKKLSYSKEVQLLSESIPYRVALIKIINSNLISHRGRGFIQLSIDPNSIHPHVLSIKKAIESSYEKEEINFYHHAFDHSSIFDTNFNEYGFKRLMRFPSYLRTIFYYARACSDKEFFNDAQLSGIFPKLDQGILDKAHELSKDINGDPSIEREGMAQLIRGILEPDTNKFIKLIFPQNIYKGN